MLGACALVLAGCGGDDDDSVADAGGEVSDAGSDGGDGGSDGGDDGGDDEEFGEALSDAMGAGGGGTLVIDGEEIPIDSVICQLGDDTFDVGTVSDSGHRVFVSRNNPLNDISASVLDPDFNQWFPQGNTGDDAERDGGSFSSATKPYFNNADDRIVEVSFSIDCP